MSHILNNIILVFLLLLFLCIANADENQWSTNGPYGGSVVTIAIHPLNNQIIYLGTVQNGMYKSTNSGGSWIHLNNNSMFLCMRDISIHPYGPDTIFAATTDGIFKSTNGGNDWAFVYTPESPHNEIRSILIHPLQPELVFAGGPINEWWSSDGGRTWERIAIPEYTGVNDISIDPGNPDFLYLVGGSLETGRGIWKSEDRGITWLNIQNNIDSIGYGTDIEIDYRNGNILYVAVSNIFNMLEGCLFKSDDGGNSWHDISPDQLTIPYVFKVAICPNEQNNIFICTSENGVLRSDTDGETWMSINSGLNSWQIPTIEIDLNSFILYLGTFYDGIYKSITNGESWQKISSNISLAMCKGIDVCSINQNKAYVAAINGLFRTMTFGQSWERVETGIHPFNSPSAVLVDKISPENIYLCTARQTFFPEFETGFYRSQDYGESWEFFTQGLPTDQSFTDMAICYADSEARIIFLASTNGVYKSENLGESWQICNNGLPIDSNFRVIDISPANPDYLAVGDRNNRVYLSSDRGDTWQQTSNLPVLDGWNINDIEFHPVEPDHFFVAEADVGMFETTDGGQSWVDAMNDLPLDPNVPVVSGITINPHNPQNMFVASNHYGVFQSHNGGQNWESFNSGLDTTNGVGEMMFAPRDTTILYFATSMRSVWTITRTPTGIETEDLPLADEISLTSYPNPFNAQTKITYYIPESGNVNVTIYDITGRKVEAIADDFMSAGNHVITWDASGFASGIYFCTIKADNKSKIKTLVLLK